MQSERFGFFSLMYSISYNFRLPLCQYKIENFSPSVAINLKEEFYKILQNVANDYLLSKWFNEPHSSQMITSHIKISKKRQNA